MTILLHSSVYVISDKRNSGLLWWSAPDRSEYGEKASPAGVAGPWPPSYLRGRSELDNPCQRNTNLLLDRESL